MPLIQLRYNIVPTPIFSHIYFLWVWIQVIIIINQVSGPRNQRGEYYAQKCHCVCSFTSMAVISEILYNEWLHFKFLFKEKRSGEDDFILHEVKLKAEAFYLAKTCTRKEVSSHQGPPTKIPRVRIQILAKS